MSTQPEWASRLEAGFMTTLPPLPNAATPENVNRARRARRIRRWLNRFAQFLAAFAGCMCGAGLYALLVGELLPGLVMLAVSAMVSGATFGVLVIADRTGGAR